MDPNKVIQIEALALEGLKAALALYAHLRSNNGALPAVETILAEANATADQVINTANEQIAAAQQK